MTSNLVVRQRLVVTQTSDTTELYINVDIAMHSFYNCVTDVITPGLETAYRWRAAEGRYCDVIIAHRHRRVAQSRPTL